MMLHQRTQTMDRLKVKVLQRILVEMENRNVVPFYEKEVKEELMKPEHDQILFDIYTTEGWNKMTNAALYVLKMKGIQSHTIPYTPCLASLKGLLLHVWQIEDRQDKIGWRKTAGTYPISNDNNDDTIDSKPLEDGN